MAERIRILLVDDDENARDGVATLLEIEYGNGIEIVGYAENGAVGIERVQELRPDVVLMDINMPVMNGIEATEQITQIDPLIGVIMLTAQDDSHYMKQAFRVRAADYVNKPVNAHELVGAINRFMAGHRVDAPDDTAAPPPPPPPGNGHVIGVLGFKGGTGKTTLAVNLAIGLAKARKRVVLVDTDIIFGDVSISLNTRSQYTIVDLAPMMSDPDQMEAETLDRVLVPYGEGLKLLLAPASPEISDAIPGDSMGKLLEYLKTQFDYIVVDTSNRLDETLLAVINAATRLIVVTTASMPALKDARIMFNELGGLEAMNKVLLALNQVEQHNQITPEQIANHLKLPIAIQVPFDLTAMNALNSGVPMVTLDPKRAPAVKPMIDMVRTVITQCETSGQPA